MRDGARKLNQWWCGCGCFRAAMTKVTGRTSTSTRTLVSTAVQKHRLSPSPTAMVCPCPCPRRQQWPQLRLQQRAPPHTLRTCLQAPCTSLPRLPHQPCLLLPSTTVANSRCIQPLPGTPPPSTSPQAAQHMPPDAPLTVLTPAPGVGMAMAVPWSRKAGQVNVDVSLCESLCLLRSPDLRSVTTPKVTAPKVPVPKMTAATHVACTTRVVSCGRICA